MKKLFYFSSIIAILFISSCSKKDDVDIRDQYIGTYSLQASISQDYFVNGQKVGTYTDEVSSGTVTVSKSGDNALLIEDEIYIVKGNQLTAEPESSDETYEDGLREILTIESSGQLGTGKITGKDTMSGTWSQDGQTGTTTGEMNWTLTKK